MRTALIYLALALASCGGAPVMSSQSGLPTLPTVAVPAYEKMGTGPIVILLATNIHDTLAGGVDYDIPQRLLAAGYTIVALDLPCHGANESPPADPTSTTDVHLDCWASRIAAGDTTIFTDFCAGLAQVIDELSVSEVSAVGVSRGAYVALTCSAYDSRIKNLALIIPLIDLNRLTEFAGVTVDPSIYGLDQYVTEMRARHILVRIGKDDTRVGTQPAVDYADKTGATLQLLDTVGHSAPEDGSTIVWLNEQLSR